MAFGDSQDFVDWYYPVTGNMILCGEGMETGTQRVAQAFCAIEEIESGLRVGFRKGQQLMASFRGNDLYRAEERDQLLPTEAVRGAGGRQRWEVAEVNRETPANQDKAEVAHG